MVHLDSTVNVWLPDHMIYIIKMTSYWLGAMVSQITSLTIVYPTVYLCADQRKYQSSASLAFMRGIHQWPMNSPHKGTVTRKLFPFDDVIMWTHKRHRILQQIDRIITTPHCSIIFPDVYPMQSSFLFPNTFRPGPTNPRQSCIIRISIGELMSHGYLSLTLWSVGHQRTITVTS